ncbi:MAG: UDP-glucose 4-epimerase GalE [Bacteroidetes bacterium GWF2_49_14]|nr:MAG: UDP-glucose 4-epimerase GalE [Bacteroidetes bacterium GWF2_49_14]HBB92843.1 UDP-glucose 4-epimerase GalE [Bacteroidales bacterium]
MKNLILVTGGTGYIGSHTAVELINEGYEVVIVDNLANSTTDSLDGIGQITGVRPAFEEFDLCNKPRLEKFFKDYPGLKAIIHFAAYKAVGESVEKPLMYYRNNLVSLMNLLECMNAYQVPSMVFSSSCTVYGQPRELPVTETAQILPAESPYGNTKQICEEILRDYIRSVEGIRAIALRYFNPIGAHPSALIGELPRGVPNNLIPYVTQTAAGIRGELKVFGDDYNTPDGSAIRDYINVVDIAAAHVKAISRLLKNQNKSDFEFFNLGTGKGSSVLEVVNTFEKVTGVKVNYKIVGRRTGDIEQVWADTTKANVELGWKAVRSLGETLLSAWNWEKKLRGIK